MAALKSSVTTLETLTAHHITSWNVIPCKGTPFDNIKYQNKHTEYHKGVYLYE